jgi:hypothetical protein
MNAERGINVLMKLVLENEAVAFQLYTSIMQRAC